MKRNFIAKTREWRPMFAQGMLWGATTMSDAFTEIRVEFPEASPALEIMSAREQAFVTLLTEQCGRKYAMRYLELVEDALIDRASTENVVLIHGDAKRRSTARNRTAGLNWWREMTPRFMRAMRRR
jgi:hypothetical protein